MANRSKNGTRFVDDFENPPAGPIGLHRGKRSFGARFAPYLIVVIVAALCALLAWGILSGNLQALLHGGQSHPAFTTAQVKKRGLRANAKKSTSSTPTSGSAKSGSAKKKSDSAATSDSTKQDAASTTQAAPDKSTQVVIFNALPATAASRNGYAGRQAAVLKNDGYTSVSAQTLSAGLPSANTVWYSDASQEATARDVASKLGISSVELQSGLREPIAAIFVSER